MASVATAPAKCGRCGKPFPDPTFSGWVRQWQGKIVGLCDVCKNARGVKPW